PAGAQRLHRRLLGGEETREVGGSRPPGERLGFAVAADTGDERLAVALQREGEAVDVDEIEADAENTVHVAVSSLQRARRRRNSPGSSPANRRMAAIPQAPAAATASAVVPSMPPIAI